MREPAGPNAMAKKITARQPSCASAMLGSMEGDQLLIAAWMRADVQLSQPEAFCQLKGIIPA
jgi:hypothetical protein